MPLYECSKCHAVENTAMANYWWKVQHEKQPALCSECDPDIGKWHGEFPKLIVDEYEAQHPNAPVIEYLLKEPPCR